MTIMNVCAMQRRPSVNDGDEKVIDYYALENPGRTSMSSYKSGLNKKKEAGGVSTPKESLISESYVAQTKNVCFSCGDMSILNEGQKLACSNAIKVTQGLERAREIWSAGRFKGAVGEYTGIKNDSRHKCEAYGASVYRLYKLRNSMRKSSNKNR